MEIEGQLAADWVESVCTPRPIIPNCHSKPLAIASIGKVEGKAEGAPVFHSIVSRVAEFSCARSIVHVFAVEAAPFLFGWQPVAPLIILLELELARSV